MYKEFALAYDALNGDADYDRLFENIYSKFKLHGVKSGAVLDAGCGTGELTLRLARVGYNVIGVDISPDMLSVLDSKVRSEGADVLLLNCDLAKLRLYESVKGAVCTFDTLNHLSPACFEKAVKRISDALEDDGVFVFDMNTPYKHTHVLGDYTFEIVGDGVKCLWDNKYNKKLARTRLAVTLEYSDGTYAYERFFEYAYTRRYIEKICKKYSLVIENVVDGETYEPLRSSSQRYCFTAVKKKEINA